MTRDADSYGRFQLSVIEAFEPLAQALERIRAMPIAVVRRIGVAVAQRPTGPGRPAILVVDDDPGIQAAWRSNLRRQAQEGQANIECLIASSADEAIRVIRLYDRIDVLVLDHLLGDQTGLEVMGAFREKFSDVLVMVSSGLDSPSLRIAYQRMGEPVEFSPKEIADKRVLDAVQKNRRGVE